MSRKFVLFASFAAAVAIFLATGSASASDRPTFLFGSGQETTVNVLDPGTATCIGGVATGNPFFPCIDSHRVLLKHQVVQTALLSAVGDAVPLLAGLSTITVDCSLDGGLKGSCWGTFEWVVNGDSTWNGVVSGKFDFSTFVLAYQLRGNGFGGIVDGMQLQYDVFYDGGFDFVGDFTARIHTAQTE